MTTDENKAIYREFIEEGFNGGDLSALDRLLAPGYINHDAPPGTSSGADGVKQIISMFRAAFPDLHIEIEAQAAEGDLVTSRATTRGTHKGVLMGVQPTEKPIAMSGLTMVRLQDGKIVEAWVKNDVAGLMRQIGAG